jgi:RNA polymerase sigma factor (sigma-70 family)
MGAPGDDDPPGSERHVEDAYTGQSARLRRLVERKFNIPPVDAEAIVNDVFASYLSRRENVRDANKWLVGAVCHASRAYWRAAARMSQLPENAAEYIDHDATGFESRIIDRVTMSAALNQLGPRCRETLRLYYAEGYSAKEIAERFDTTTGYVIQLLHVCRKRVRQAYDALKEKKP